MNEEHLSRLLQLSQDELFRQLGIELERVAPGSKPLSAEEEKALGKGWFARNRDRLANIVCNNSQIIAYRTSKKAQNRVQLAAAILDITAAAAGVVAPATVAGLIVNEGLDSLCSET